MLIDCTKYSILSTRDKSNSVTVVSLFLKEKLIVANLSLALFDK